VHHVGVTLLMHYDARSAKHYVCVLILSTKLSETFLVLIRMERGIVNVLNVRGSSCKLSLFSYQILKNLEFSRQIFAKFSNIKFHEDPCSGSRAVPCARTDAHDVANTRSSQFCEMPTFWLQRELTWYSEQTGPLYIIEWFLIPRRRVYCAVQTEYLNLLHVNFLGKALSHSLNQRCIAIWAGGSYHRPW
jgi:hypothetical protein